MFKIIHYNHILFTNNLCNEIHYFYIQNSMLEQSLQCIDRNFPNSIPDIRMVTIYYLSLCKSVCEIYSVVTDIYKIGKVSFIFKDASFCERNHKGLYFDPIYS